MKSLGWLRAGLGSCCTSTLYYSVELFQREKNFVIYMRDVRLTDERKLLIMLLTKLVRVFSKMDESNGVGELIYILIYLLFSAYMHTAMDTTMNLVLSLLIVFLRAIVREYIKRSQRHIKNYYTVKAWCIQIEEALNATIVICEQAEK